MWEDNTIKIIDSKTSSLFYKQLIWKLSDSFFNLTLIEQTRDLTWIDSAPHQTSYGQNQVPQGAHMNVSCFKQMSFRFDQNSLASLYTNVPDSQENFKFYVWHERRGELCFQAKRNWWIQCGKSGETRRQNTSESIQMTWAPIKRRAAQVIKI